jgi:parvulin-like peptidyl-prolyl isomerase
MRTLHRLSLGLLALALASCSAVPGLAPSPTPPPPTSTPIPPTATPPPLAATVNGEPILLSDFQAEVARYEAAQTAHGTDLATLRDYKAQVLDSMIDLSLLAQGAKQAGAQLSDDDVQAKIDQLASDLGGNETIGAWLAANQYDVVGFQRELKQELLAAQMVDKLKAEVPDSMDQVHARHILVATRSQAEQIRQQIADGGDFVTLAVENSIDLSTRPAGGDLGWFPQGYLTSPEIEQAAFSLQPGDVSQVIETKLGFDIVEVLERANYPLSPDAKRHLQAAAVQDWLSTQRETAQIDIIVNP